MDKLKWWGYLHTNGSMHVKRWWDNRDCRILDEARDSGFTEIVIDPFEADNRDEALKILESKLAVWPS